MAVLVLILMRIAPIFLILLLGYLAFSLKWVDDAFIGSANRLVFYAALPALIFLSILDADFGNGFPWREIVSFIAAMLLIMLTAWLVGRLLKLKAPQAASFGQGALRGNFAILGLAIIEQVLGEAWLPRGALILAFLLPIHNFGSIIVLTSYSASSEQKQHLLQKGAGVIIKTLRNPLTIAIILGVLVSLLSFELPAVLFDALTYLRRLALPLALIGIGGSMRAYRAGGHYPLAFGSSALKLLLLPAFALATGSLLGLAGEELAILAIFTGVPTGVTSYAMADALGGDRDTAGSIVIVSTALCFLTLPLLLTLLKLAGSI
jgi:predicted permease